MTENKTVVSIGKMRWMLFLLGKVKIPLIGYLNPTLISLDDDIVKVKMKFRRRSKNHLNSMYFGALAVGADIAGGIHAFYFSKKYAKKVSFAFKSMNVDFIKRAESDVTFECTQGHIIEQSILESFSKKERINKMVQVEAKNVSGEIVALFEMEISVKVY